MLGILLDAAVLMVLIKAFNDEEVGFGTAILVAIVAAIGTAVLTIALAQVMGIAGIAVGAVAAAAVLGFAVSAFFGVEIKRAWMIAGIFMVVHIGFGLGMRALLG